MEDVDSGEVSDRQSSQGKKIILTFVLECSLQHIQLNAAAAALLVL